MFFPAAGDARLADCFLRLILSELELRRGSEVVGGEVFEEELGPGGGSDHRGVVGGEGERGKGDREALGGGFGLKTAAQLTVGGDSAGDDDAAGSKALGGGQGLADEDADDGVLEARDEVEGLGVHQGERVFGTGVRDLRERGLAGVGGLPHAVRLHVAEYGGLDTGEGEVEAWAGLG